MSTQQNREKAAQMWAALQPVFIDLIADMLDAPPPGGEAETDGLTAKDLEKIKVGVSKWRAGKS